MIPAFYPGQGKKRLPFFGLLFLLILMANCRSEKQVAQDPSASKDLGSFTLPEATRKKAPKMQQHLMTLLPYNGVRHKIKPSFVFLDEDRVELGKLDPTVTRLNLLHLAYYQRDQLVWSGSLLNAVKRGIVVFSYQGYGITLAAESDQFSFSFNDGSVQFESVFPCDEDHEQWFQDGSARLYINHYVFPESLVSSP